MSLATLSSNELARVQKLVGQKEALIQQIAEINSELEAIASGAHQPARAAKPAPRAAVAHQSAPAMEPIMSRKNRRARRTVRGALKERVSDELKSAGRPGMKVKDLAARLGSSYGNIANFFQNAGKNMKEIKKVGPGRFTWVGV